MPRNADLPEGTSQFSIIWPDDVKEGVRELSKKNRRSINAEVLTIVEAHLAEYLRTEYPRPSLQPRTQSED